MCERANVSGVFRPCRRPDSSATIAGATVRGPTKDTRMCGHHSPSTVRADWSTCPSVRQATTGMAASERERICLQKRFSVSMRAPANACGTIRSRTTDCGTTIFPRRRISSRSHTMVGVSMPWPCRRSRDFCSSSIGSPASHSGPSKNARCPRVTCPAKPPGPPSPSPPSLRHSRGRGSPLTT